MKTKKPQRTIMVIGIILIFCSLISYILGDQYYKMQNISQTIEKSFGVTGKGFKVKTTYGINGYKVYITLNNTDNLFIYSSWCGMTSTNYLKNFKHDHGDIDKQIGEYHFIFLKRYESQYTYSSDYYPTAYTARYINGHDEASLYQIKIGLNDGKKEAEAKTYLQYLKEWSTQKYRSSDYIKLNGEHYSVKINDDDSYTIEPISSDDLHRNPDSTLMLYMEEYASQYFAFSNVKMEITNDDSGSKVNINYAITNCMRLTPIDAKIWFYLYNNQGNIIGVIRADNVDLEPNESKEFSILVSGDEIPSYFRIGFIEFFKGSNKDKIIIVFE